MVEQPGQPELDASRDPLLSGASEEHSWDVALARLEDYLLAYPLDRALPDLQHIVHAADLTVDFLLQDERAVKVIHEAIHARPLSTPNAVAAVRSEVEMLTLEAQVLGSTLRSPDADPAERDGAQRRLQVLRRRLDEIRRIL